MSQSMEERRYSECNGHSYTSVVNCKEPIENCAKDCSKRSYYNVFSTKERELWFWLDIWNTSVNHVLVFFPFPICIFFSQESFFLSLSKISFFDAAHVFFILGVGCSTFCTCLAVKVSPFSNWKYFFIYIIYSNQSSPPFFLLRSSQPPHWFNSMPSFFLFKKQANKRHRQALCSFLF